MKVKSFDFVGAERLDRDKLWKHLKVQESGNRQFDRFGRTIVSREKNGDIIAVGISQIRPLTAKNVAEQNGIKYDRNRLFKDSDYNEKLGRLLFEENLNKYGGDAQKALSAYHGGSIVDRKLKESGDAWFQGVGPKTRAYSNAILENYAADSSDTSVSRPAKKYLGPYTPVASIPSDEEFAKHQPKQDQDIQPNASAFERDPQIKEDSVTAAQSLSVHPGVPVKQHDIDNSVGSNPIVIEDKNPVPPESGDSQFDFVSTEEELSDNPPSSGPTNPLAVPGVSMYPSDYYEANQATHGAVRDNSGFISRFYDRVAYNSSEGESNAIASTLNRWDAEWDAYKAGEKKLSKDEANSKYPHLAAKFTEDVYPAVAEMAESERKRRAEYAAWNDSSDGLGPVAGFAAGVVASVLDPVNIALNIAADVVLPAKGIVAILSSNALQGIASETLVRYNREKEQDPISFQDSAFNVAAGAVGGTAIHYLLRGAGNVFDRAKNSVSKKSPEAIKENMIRVFKQHESGQKTSVSEQENFDARNRAGVIPSASGVAHVHSDNPDIQATQFFAPLNHDGKPSIVGDDIGYGDNGVSIVSNPEVARGSTDSRVDAPGHVIEVKVKPGVKLVPLSDPIDSVIGLKVFTRLGEIVSKLNLPDKPTIGDVIRAVRESEISGDIPDGSTKTVSSAFKEEGFSGYQDTIAFNGIITSHRLHIFDKNSLERGDLRSVDMSKYQRMTPGEKDENQKSIDRPENMRNYVEDPKTLVKLSEPNALGVPEQIQLESDRARKSLDIDAQTDSSALDELSEIDDLFKRESVAADSFLEFKNRGYSPERYTEIREALLKSGSSDAAELSDEIVDVLKELRSGSTDDVDFRNRADRYLEEDLVGWATKKKIERELNLLKFQNAKIAINQTVFGFTGELSKFEKLYSWMIGGEARQSKGLNRSTATSAAGFGTIFRQRLRSAWGQDGIRAVESGKIGREIVQELDHIGNGGTGSVSGVEMAFKIAKAYFDVSAKLFSIKSGYNPFIERIKDHYFKQTWDRELVSAVPEEEFVAFLLMNYSKKSFIDLDIEKKIAQYSRIYREITSGTHGQSSWDFDSRSKSVFNQMSKNRTLIPDTWESFYEANNRFGKGNIGLTFDDAIEASARQIAVMSQFGSKPHEMVRKLLDYAESVDPKFKDDYTAGKTKFLAAFEKAIFNMEAPAINMKAKALVGTQKVINSAVNGLQYIRAFQDFGVSAANLNNDFGEGFFTNFSRLFTEYWKSFPTMSAAQSAEAAERLGIFVDTAHKNLVAELGGETNKGALGKLTELHSWASLATKHKATLSSAIGKVIAYDLAKIANTKWGDLSDVQRIGLGKYLIEKKDHAILKHGIEIIDGKGYLTPNGVMEAIEKSVHVQATLLGVNPNDIIDLESSPTIKTKKNSAYEKSDGLNPYADSKDVVLFPRPELGVNIGNISKAYSPESTSSIASDVHKIFTDKSYSSEEAHVPAVLISTFFDSIGKHTGKDPLELYKNYGFHLERLPESVMNSLGSLSVYYTGGHENGGRGKIKMTTMSGVINDKTVLHESSHFFLEALRDIHHSIVKDPGFTSEPVSSDIRRLFNWLETDPAGNITVAAHERFANSFEVFLRTNKAPTPAMNGLFAKIRDWYRRAIFMFKAGLSKAPFSLYRPERAPAEVEGFYNKLMGGSGAVEHLGMLTSAMETMPQEDIARIYSSADSYRNPVPTQATDLVLKVASLINEHSDMGTTSASQRERVFMHRGTNINDPLGVLLRTMWAFKSSSISQFNSMRRSFYSNPNKPSGDFLKIAHTGLTMAGLWAIQEQTKQLFYNKTPKKMDEPKFWMEALVGSGALGMFGDTVLRDVASGTDTRSAQLMFFKSAFPTIGTAASVGISAGFGVKSIFDKETKFPSNDIGRELVSNLPFQNIFYSRALMHGYFLDGIREFFDPSFRRKEELRDSKNGQKRILQ